MEIPLSQESIHMPEKNRRCQTKVLDRVYRGQAAQLGVTTYDLQLWKVITPSSELRLGCSWTLGSLSQEFIHRQLDKIGTNISSKKHEKR